MDQLTRRDVLKGVAAAALTGSLGLSVATAAAAPAITTYADWFLWCKRTYETNEKWRETVDAATLQLDRELRPNHYMRAARFSDGGFAEVIALDYVIPFRLVHCYAPEIIKSVLIYGNGLLGTAVDWLGRTVLPVCSTEVLWDSSAETLHYLVGHPSCGYSTWKQVEHIRISDTVAGMQNRGWSPPIIAPAFPYLAGTLPETYTPAMLCKLFHRSAFKQLAELVPD